MIELPEAITIARQITETLKGKVIASAMRGNTPHKFAFYTKGPEEYAAILPGKTIGSAVDDGGCIIVDVDPDWLLQLGGGGERIRYHADASTLPAKHHLMLSFTDGSHLTVSVQGWGCAQLWSRTEERWSCGSVEGRVPVLGPDFTWDAFQTQFRAVPPEDPRAVKYYLISKPGACGVGNGYAQDILFRAGLHPRRRAVSLSDAELRAFYDAIVGTMRDAVALDGRECEQDLFGRPGRYRPAMDRWAKGAPCPTCGATVEVIAFLGGKCYFCPACQPL